MGRHSAEHIPVRDLRSAYIRLREAYEGLVRDHLELKNAVRHGLLGDPPGGPLPWAPVWGSEHLAVGSEPLGVEAACELVRSSGLLTSPGA